MSNLARKKRGQAFDTSDDEDQRTIPPNKYNSSTMASRHESHKRRQQQFNSNRFINLDEVEAPDASVTAQSVEKPLPPIIITQQLKNVKGFHETAKQWGTNVYFKCVKEQQHILTYKSDDYKSIQEKLKEARIHFVTFTPASEKPRRAVIKGISETYDEQDVLSDLKQQSSDVINVTKMKTKRNGQLTELNICLVSLKPASSIVKFAKQVQYCCNHKVTVEHYVKPKRLRGTQCFNCQQYGHIARNCGQPYRCVKCDKNHSRGECMKMEEAPPTCSNCHGSHTANFRGCPAAAKYLKRFEPAQQTFTSYSNVVKNSNRSYQQSNGTSQLRDKGEVSEKAKMTSKREQQQNSLFSFNDEIQKLFGQDLISVMTKVKDFMPNYLKVKVKDDNTKKIMILEFLFTFISNDVPKQFVENNLF